LFDQYHFLLTIAWGWFLTMGHIIILFSLPNNAIDIEISDSQAAIVYAPANLGMAIGWPVVEYFSEYLGRINMVVVATLLCCCSVRYSPCLC
jgi:MFS family permease